MHDNAIGTPGQERPLRATSRAHPVFSLGDQRHPAFKMLGWPGAERIKAICRTLIALSLDMLEQME